MGAMAGIFGYWYASQKNTGEAEIQQKEPVSTVGWKEYLNSKYGYKIKYPQGWQIKGTSTSGEVVVGFIPETDEEKILNSAGQDLDSLEVSVKENPNSLSSRDWVLENLSADTYERRNLRDETYGTNSATKIIDCLDSSYTVFFARESSIYQILVYQKDKADELEAIINSFEFTATTAKEYQTYTVKEGETLSFIASKFNIAWPKLASYNKIKSPDQVYAGQKLKIPLDPNAVPTSSDTTSINMELARTYQNNVDSGREVWRLDPLEVAKKEIPPQKDITSDDSFRVITEDRLAGVVSIEIINSSGQKFEATLVQPVRKGSGGIWMVKSLTAK